MLQSTGSQRIRHDLVTEQQQQKDNKEEKSLLPHEQRKGGKGKTGRNSNAGANAQVQEVARTREVAVVKNRHRWIGDISLEIELVGFASQLKVKVEEAEGIRNDSSVSS